jgi:serine/threonine protein kinase
MGEVYRAADDRLNREVAIKILPASVEGDADRLARFRREAQLLAALSHGNIAAVYGLEEQDGQVAIVLELVEGETLEERIARGPIPFDDASEIATQIAVAFEVAHEKGIIHRDLKPANVKITPEGVVKVLDFGLAKALAVETASGDAAHATTSPTVTSAQTRDGVILGTAAYMSPEQARGKPVDRRADIWAFGALFYEMLTGRTAFAGETVSDTLVAILSGEANLDALPNSVPSGARQLIARCLEKDAKRRLRDIGEARIALEDLAAGVETPLADQSRSIAPVATAMPRSRWIGLALAAVAAFVAGWLLRAPEPTVGIVPDDRSIRRLSYNDHLEFAPSLSPDGNYVVYTTNQNGNLDLEVMPLGGGSVNRLTDDPADDAQATWSPDGRRIAFVSGRERESGLMVSAGGLGQDSVYVVSEGGDIFMMPALGGAATKLVDRASYPTWSPDSKSIVFQSNRDGRWRLWTIPADGGEPVQLTQYDDDRYDFHPSWSPDGKWIAFGSLTPNAGRGLFVIPATGGDPIEIYDGDALSPAWAPDSRGVYFSSSRTASDGRHNLWFVPFDPNTETLMHPKRITVGTGSDVGIRVSVDGTR